MKLIWLFLKKLYKKKLLEIHKILPSSTFFENEWEFSSFSFPLVKSMHLYVKILIIGKC